MIGDEIESPGDMTTAELLSRYEAEVSRAIEAAGEDRVAEATGLSPAEVEAAAGGDAADLELDDVAAILALSDGEADAETVIDGARNRLMLEMSGAALNVDRVAIAIDVDLDPKEIQAKMEGRLPMTLAEYAALRHHVAAKADW